MKGRRGQYYPIAMCLLTRIHTEVKGKRGQCYPTAIGLLTHMHTETEEMEEGTMLPYCHRSVNMHSH